MRTINDVTLALEPFGFIGWTLAATKTDAYPRSFAGTWDDLVQFINKYRARRKGVHGLAGLYANNGRRCLENALPRAWMAFDLDGRENKGVSDAVLDRAIKEFEGLTLVWYETASSKPNFRKARILVQASKPLTNFESTSIGNQIALWSGLADNFDKSVYQLSQVCYLPPIHVPVFAEQGVPLDVDRILSKIPKPLPKPVYAKPNTPAPDAKSFFAANGLVKREAADGLHVVCPWADSHSANDTTGTFYFNPSPSNGYVGGFKCHHAHCDGRSIGDVFRLMEGVR
jgi:hypothetical protein